MTPSDALLLGGLQGATEFLPVSSSGHLVLTEHLLGLRPTLAFNAALHAGTLGAVVWYYRRDLSAIILQVFRSLRGIFRGRALGHIWKEDHGTRLGLLLILATVPTGVLGLALKSTVERSLSSGLFTSLALLVTGALLIATRFAKVSVSEPPVSSPGSHASAAGSGSHGPGRTHGPKSPHGPELSRVTPWIALAVGVAQGLAVFPGISRSGATLATILLLGVARADGARFCFLLSIPAILGALFLEAGALAELGADRTLPLVLGVGAALVVGYFSLVLLVALVRRGGLHYFAWYVIPLAVVGIWHFSR